MYRRSRGMHPQETSLGSELQDMADDTERLGLALVGVRMKIR